MHIHWPTLEPTSNFCMTDKSAMHVTSAYIRKGSAKKLNHHLIEILCSRVFIKYHFLYSTFPFRSGQPLGRHYAIFNIVVFLADMGGKYSARTPSSPASCYAISNRRIWAIGQTFTLSTRIFTMGSSLNLNKWHVSCFILNSLIKT